MTRHDPQAMTGVVAYEPHPRCECGDLWTAHQVMRDGHRGRCTVVTTARECRCRRYVPNPLDGDQ